VFVSRIDDVERLHRQGLSGKAIAEELGVAPPTVCYYLRRLGVPKQRQGRYDWNEVQAYYDQGHSVRDCVDKFGFSHQTWHAAMLRGDVRTRPPGMPIDELLVRHQEPQTHQAAAHSGRPQAKPLRAVRTQQLDG